MYALLKNNPLSKMQVLEYPIHWKVIATLMKQSVTVVTAAISGAPRP